MSILLYGAKTWPVPQHDVRRLKTFQMRCLRDIMGVTRWDKRLNVDILEETGELPIEEQQHEAEEAPVVWTPAEDARPSTTYISSCKGGGREERRGGQDGILCGGWILLVSRDLTGITNWQEVATDSSAWRAAIYPPTKVNNPILICDKVEQLNPAQCPRWTRRKEVCACVCAQGVYIQCSLH